MQWFGIGGGLGAAITAIMQINVGIGIIIGMGIGALFGYYLESRVNN
nr:hypothetical protein [archaeon]